MKTLLQAGLAAWNIPYTEDMLETFGRFCTSLLETNKIMNLTALKTPEEVAVKHFLDCAYLGKAVSLSGRRLIDVGCGAGFPGIPLKILNPDCDVLLLDSLAKRIRFLEDFLQEEGMRGIAALHGRAEEAVKDRREQFDVAVSRAVAKLPLLAELCLPYVRPGGVFVAMKSIFAEEEIRDARRAVSALGGSLSGTEDYTIPGTEITHRLVFIRKDRQTPARFPRRFDKMIKNPL